MHTLTTTSDIYTSIGHVAERIFATGKITREDNQALLRAALQNSILTPSEMVQVRGLFDRLQMGLLKVID